MLVHRCPCREAAIACPGGLTPLPAGQLVGFSPPPAPASFPMKQPLILNSMALACSQLEIHINTVFLMLK